jgi:hypothetical protein
MGHSSAAVRYQPAGAGQKMRRAIFDLAAIPDPQGWLEERLGALALFEADASRAGTPETSCVSGQTIPSCDFAASIPADVHSRLTALSHRLDAAVRRVLDDARGRLGDLAVVLIVSRPSTLVTLGDDPPFDPIVPAQRPLAPSPLRLVEHRETVPPQRPGESMFDWSCRAMQELQAAGVSYPRASRMVMKHDFRFVPAPEADEPIADEAAL